MKVLNFGSCNIDYVYSVEHIVVPGETISANNLELFAGGKGLNQSIAVAKAGGKVFHAGCIGEDGDMLNDILTENKVDTSYLKRSSCKNGHAVIQVSAGGENSIFLFGGSNQLIDKEYINSVLAEFGKNDIIILQNEINNIEYIIDEAYKKGMQIVFNPAPFSENLKEIDLSKISYLILNETECEGFTGTNDSIQSLNTILNNAKDLKVVLTLGKSGAVYADATKRIHQSAFKVTAVDTTAAGDTFIGYFVFGLITGISMEENLKFCCAASALAVTKKGAAPSIPCYTEVEKALKEFSEYNPSSSLSLRTKVISKYIKENLKSANLEELSKKLGYSRVYTGKLIKDNFGLTFSDLLCDYRLTEAAKLLKNTRMPIIEIIESVGYTNETFFRNKFKEKYNTLPLKYRKERQ